MPAQLTGKFPGQHADLLLAQWLPLPQQPPRGRKSVTAQHSLPEGQHPFWPVPFGQQPSSGSQHEEAEPAGQLIWFGAHRHCPLLEQTCVLVQEPQVPPQPSAPQLRLAQFGLHFFFFFFFLPLASSWAPWNVARPSAAVAAPHRLTVRRESRSVSDRVRWSNRDSSIVHPLPRVPTEQPAHAKSLPRGAASRVRLRFREYGERPWTRE